MKRFAYTLILSLLICSQAFGANFYWKSSLSELNAITGVTNADKAVVMSSDNMATFYSHASGAWAEVGVNTSDIITKGPWVDVRAYGAVAGTTDSTSAFNAAVAALGTNGGDVVFPPGRFKVNIVLTQSNVGVVGSAMSGDTGILSRLEPYDTTKPVIQIGNDNGTVSGWRLRNLSLQGNHTGTKGLYLAGGATAGSYENVSIYYFTEYCLRIQAGATYNTTFNFGDKLFLAPSDASALSTVRTLLVRNRYPTDAVTSANFINNAQIYGNSSNGYALEIDSAQVFMSNTWVEAYNNHGLKLSHSAVTGTYPRIYASNVFVDSGSSSDTLVQWYDNNVPLGLFGTIHVDGKYALDNGTTTNSMTDRLGTFSSPIIYNEYHMGPLNFGESTDHSPISTHRIYKENTNFIIESAGNIRLLPVVGDNTGEVQISYGGGILNTGRLIGNNIPSSAPAAGSHEFWYDPADGNRLKYAP